MNNIAKVKKEVQLKQWAEMVQCRNKSGLTVTQWCADNNINLKTYYYRLKKVREAMCNEIETHDIVPVTPQTETEEQSARIDLLVGDVKISLPDNFSSDALRKILEVLK